MSNKVIFSCALAVPWCLLGPKILSDPLKIKHLLCSFLPPQGRGPRKCGCELILASYTSWWLWVCVCECVYWGRGWIPQPWVRGTIFPMGTWGMLETTRRWWGCLTRKEEGAEEEEKEGREVKQSGWMYGTKKSASEGFEILDILGVLPVAYLSSQKKKTNQKSFFVLSWEHLDSNACVVVVNRFVCRLTSIIDA